MANIGYITTFAEFINKYHVEIPRIQRDYTYGSETEKTKKVLKKMLDDIHEALVTGNELILDFVYGSENQYFNPLDGQQRLTTLYLIYFYAACKAGISLDKAFKYATRDDSTIFCNELIGLLYDKELGSIVDQIKDDAFFRPSFYDDPSVRSILVVLSRIEERFADLVPDEAPDYLWKLLRENCPVKFYCLNFGEFSLSDDLYIKMNSRGKQLTEYEIFKAQLEKYIEVEMGDKDLKYRTARLFDNDFTDLVWSAQGRDKSKIDVAFVQLFKNLFLLVNFVNKEGNVAFDWGKSLFDNMRMLALDQKDLAFICDILDQFHYVQTSCPQFYEEHFYQVPDVMPSEIEYQSKVRFFKANVNIFGDACKGVLKNPQLVSLYAVYAAIKRHRDGVEWLNNFRHIRNLIEFSDDELGHAERLSRMLQEIELILDGCIDKIEPKDSKFNTNQFIEELEKAKHQDVWKLFFEYENHDILRGTLAHFAHPDVLDLGNAEVIRTIELRLQKFAAVFDNWANPRGKKASKDRLIRASLLSIGDFSQQHSTDLHNRMYGCQYNSWRILFTPNNWYSTETVKVMSVLDQVDIDNPHSVRSVSPNDWRYYAVEEKYRDYTYVSYGEAKYGFFYFKDIEKPLEVWLLQSTSCYENNVMWKLLNNLLYENMPEGITVEIGRYQEDCEVKISNTLLIDALQEGWKITDKSEDQVFTEWLSKNKCLQDGLLPYRKDTDYIEDMVATINEMVEAGFIKRTA